MFEKRLRWSAALLALALSLILTSAALAVEAEEGTLAIAVSAVEEWKGGEGKKITLDYDNQTGNTVSFGWVGSCQLLVETDEGAYALSLNGVGAKMEAGAGTTCFELTPCPGTVETVTLTELNLLDGNGLPERKLADVVIEQLGEDGAVQCDFSLAPTLQEEFFAQAGVGPYTSSPDSTVPPQTPERPQSEPDHLPAGVQSAAGGEVTEFTEQLEQVREQTETASRWITRFIVLILILIPCAVVVTIVLYRKQRKNDFASVAPFAVPPEINGTTHGQRWTFSRKNISEEDFIQRVNNWFLAYPRLVLTGSRFTCGTGEGAFTKRSYLNALEIKYDLLEQTTGVFYAVAALTRLGLREHSGEELMEQWKASNPGAKILTQQEILHQRGTGGISPKGIGDSNFTQVYLLYQTARGPRSSEDRAETHSGETQDGPEFQRVQQFVEEPDEDWAREEAERFQRQMQQQEVQREFDAFSRQSVTPVDQGGFVPPPPPPQPPF